MAQINLAFAKKCAFALFVFCSLGTVPVNCLAQQHEDVTLPYKIIDDEEFELTFRLPIQVGLESSVEKWGLAAPIVDEVSDPNLICYDQKYMHHFVEFVFNRVTSCGAGSYFVITDDEEIEFTGGLDESYLGQRFKANDLIKFLENRIADNAETKTTSHKVKDAARLLPQLKRSLNLSPWERDIYNVISLLAQSKHQPGYAAIKSLTDDPNESIRYGAIMGLRHFVQTYDAAAEDLGELLKDDQLAGHAMDSLRSSGPKAVPVIVKAIHSDNERLINQAVYSLPWITDSLSVAEPAWMAALDHENRKVRGWAMSALHDRCSRGVDVDLSAFEEVLMERESDKTDLPDTRKSATRFLKLIDK